MESLRQYRWWRNPPGAVAARMDEGRYVRERREWVDLFGSHPERLTIRSLYPCWPVPMIEVRFAAK